MIAFTSDSLAHATSPRCNVLEFGGTVFVRFFYVTGRALRRSFETLRKALVPAGILISGNFRASFRIFKSRSNPWKSLCSSDPAAAVNDTRSGDPSKTFKEHWSQGVFLFPETSGRVSGYLKVAGTLGNPYVSVTRPPQ